MIINSEASKKSMSSHASFGCTIVLGSVHFLTHVWVDSVLPPCGQAISLVADAERLLWDRVDGLTRARRVTLWSRVS